MLPMMAARPRSRSSVGAGVGMYVYCAAAAARRSAPSPRASRASTGSSTTSGASTSSTTRPWSAWSTPSPTSSRWPTSGSSTASSPKLTSALVGASGTVLRAFQTGRVQAYSAAMVIGLAGAGLVPRRGRTPRSRSTTSLHGQRASRPLGRAGPRLPATAGTSEGAGPGRRHRDRRPEPRSSEGGDHVTLSPGDRTRSCSRCETRSASRPAPRGIPTQPLPPIPRRRPSRRSSRAQSGRIGEAPMNPLDALFHYWPASSPSSSAPPVPRGDDDPAAPRPRRRRRRPRRALARAGPLARRRPPRAPRRRGARPSGRTCSTSSSSLPIARRAWRCSSCRGSCSGSSAASRWA